MIAADYPTMLAEYVDAEYTYPGYRTDAGNGIIYVGGGKYWPGIVVGIKLLRKLGCKLPVEIYYRGKCEVVYPEDVEGLNATLIDIDVMGYDTGLSTIPQGVVKSGGWEAKLTAMMFTGFNKVLYLDADAYCVNDPTELFNKYEGSLLTFWRDMVSQANSIKWNNVYPLGPQAKIPQIQGGQLLIDRERGSHMIHIANYLCQRSSYYFKHMYGDQDTWRVALAILKLTGRDATYTEIDKAKWQGIAFICSIDSIPYVIHRCQGKLFQHADIPAGRVAYSNPQYHLPRETEVFDLLAEVVNKRQCNSVDVFTDIYTKRLWGLNSSGSGSRGKEATQYATVINEMVRNLGISSIVDCGSGDGIISRMLRVDRYTGLDCSAKMVGECKRKYQDERKQYYAVDFYANPQCIPSADMLLCKDVLHHWPNEMVRNFLDALTESKRWKYLVFTQDCIQRHSQQDCMLGGYRALSLTLDPLARYPFVEHCRVFNKSVAVITRE